MTESVQYEQFDQAEPPGGGPLPDIDLRRLSDVPMELSVEIGRTHMTVGETLQLRAGSIVTLDRLAGEPVDLLVNGTPIARGEVVVVEEQFGLRVTEILEGRDGADGPPPAAPAADGAIDAPAPTSEPTAGAVQDAAPLAGAVDGGA